MCVTAATIKRELEVVPDESGESDTNQWAIPGGCLIFAVFLLLIIEVIMLLLHVMNPSHLNNNYLTYC